MHTSCEARSVRDSVEHIGEKDVVRRVQNNFAYGGGVGLDKRAVRYAIFRDSIARDLQQCSINVDSGNVSGNLRERQGESAIAAASVHGTHAGAECNICSHHRMSWAKYLSPSGIWHPAALEETRYRHLVV